MTVLDVSSRTGLEIIQTEALVVLYQQLNTALTEMTAACNDYEDELSDRLGIIIDHVDLEPVDTTPHGESQFGNFYTGHHPSLIDAPIERYPNVAVIADRFDPLPGSIDQGQEYLDRIRIEVMAKSEVSEDEVNKRAQRLMDAVNAVIQANPTLNGVVQGLDEQTRGFIGDVFPRETDTSYGDRWFWQGARLDYTVRKMGVTTRDFSRAFYSGIDQTP